METKVESFLIKENESLINNKEHSDEWKKMVEELGLVKQATLTEDTPTDSPIPFYAMKRTQYEILSIVTPMHTEYKDFDFETIPLEALKMIKLAQDYFEKIEIWYDSSPDPDPVVVGILRPDKWSFSEKKIFMIARWGDEFVNWDKLKDSAFKRLKEMKLTKLRDKAARIEIQIRGIDREVSKQLSGEYISWED